MANEFMYIVGVIIVVIIVVMVWNSKHENIYIPPLAPNQVYQGDYTNSLTGGPRVWSCPPGTAGVGCKPVDEGYRHSGMEPLSDHAPINIIAPPMELYLKPPVSSSSIP